jgi:hypothetical protein
LMSIGAETRVVKSEEEEEAAAESVSDGAAADGELADVSAAGSGLSAAGEDRGDERDEEKDTEDRAAEDEEDVEEEDESASVAEVTRLLLLRPDSTSAAASALGTGEEEVGTAALPSVAAAGAPVTEAVTAG